MSTVTKSIGTSGRDYSTITAWEADLDNAAVYASGDHAVGECYNDSAFDESVTIDGGGTIGLASVTLTVAAGERHSGIAGTGARIVTTSAHVFSSGTADIGWLEISRGGTVINNFISTGGGTLSQLLIHATAPRTSPVNGIFVGNVTQPTYVLDCIVYGIVESGTSTGYASGIRVAMGSGDTLIIANCTVHAIANTDGSGHSVGVYREGSGTTTCVNTIATDVTGTTSGTIACFYGNITQSYNLSSDATAIGTGSLVNKVSANQFVSTVVGSEDLHLKAGADAIDAGTDLGTTPTCVNIDIDGRDRDAEGDVWDIGADEYVNPVARFPWQVRRERRMAGAR